jgi:hypothetical protein
LPARIDAGVLPSSMLQELLDRIAQLSPLGRDVLSYAVLADDRALTFDEYAALCSPRTPVEVSAALLDLTGLQLAAVSGDTYVLHRLGTASIVIEQLAPERKRAMHHGLAQIFARREQEEIRRAKHLMAAGEEQAGLTVLLEATARSQALTDADANEYLKLTAAR